MKTASTLKPSKTDSPKTPGGISRSLLTPCRRVGLSRNFKKSGASPFQSPLPSNTEVKRENIETRKRKESLQETAQKQENTDDSDTYSDVIQTPTRNVELPRRKKSKTLLASINKSTEESAPETPTKVKISTTLEDKPVPEIIQNSVNVQNKANAEVVSTPVRLKSKSRSKKKIALSVPISTDTPAIDVEKEDVSIKSTSVETKDKLINEQEKPKVSPNNLTKECIVVIQKKIFKKQLKVNQETSIDKPNNTVNHKDTVSQALFDSDTDDIPLICHKNKDTTTPPVKLKTIDEDDDFATNKTRSTKPENSKSSLIKTNAKSPISTKNKKSPRAVNIDVHKPDSQSSVDDDDDFFEKKRTILIKKSYNKVLKPQKAKSTGSITQKDIDELKAKIEMKKKMLLAKGMTEDTKELRDLIKKWQKGCQDALMELMDLMKSKFPDKQNMDYSEMLQTLKIPSSLVGYDSDNDCFNTPEDESIILAKVKD